MSILAFALALGPAGATAPFDPTAPAARFEGREAFDADEVDRLWDAVERWDDPDRVLLPQEAFNEATAWQDLPHTPWIASSFGTATPRSSTFLLHTLGEDHGGVPVLLVPGAGDNATRAFASTLAPALAADGRPVFALTFAHPHGDVFAQAEILADALAVITARTGAAQVDLVAHSKGGMAAAVYLASARSDVLGAADYTARGTPYRGDVRRVVLVAAPLAGVDTSYRWSGLNLVGLDADTALTPTSWSVYYPSGVGVPWWYIDLADQDLLPDGRDLFPGQRQLLARQPAPLPGSRAWLGVYALQQDWLTTYEGGFGFVSWSDGIDAAIDAGGDLIARLATAGTDPDVEVYQLVGTSPLLVNADDGLAEQFALLGVFVDYPALLGAMGAHGNDVAADPAEFEALDDGALVLGEISAPSDGVVFVSSASDTRAITARGGALAERLVVDLAHLDLLYASTAAGEGMIAAAAAGGPAWLHSLGERYVAADTVGWMVRVLGDGAVSDDSEGAVDDTDGSDEDRARIPGQDEETTPAFASGCDTGRAGVPAGWLVGLGLLGLALRQRWGVERPHAWHPRTS